MGLAWSKDTLSQAVTQPIQFKSALPDAQSNSQCVGGEFEEPKSATTESFTLA
jgi:hypothetical protein